MGPLRAARAPVGVASFAVVLLIVTGGLGFVYFYSGPSAPTPGQNPHPSVPGGDTVFLNATALPTLTSTASASSSQTPGAGPAYAEFFPSGPPQIVLGYDNMPFTGAQGSYCWPPAVWGPTKCVNADPLASGSIPLVAVYPRPNVTLTSTLASGLQGFMIKLYSEHPLSQVFSGAVTGYHPYGFPLNFTSGDYLLGVYASYGSAEVSSYYNLTTVATPNSRVDSGLRVQIGSPAVHYVSFTAPQSTSSGPSWEDWPLTVYSNTTTDVDLSAGSVIDGVWVQFVPSHLANVGPAGTTTHMLLAGAVKPFVNNDISNVSMIIRATGQNGARGQVLLPVERTWAVTPIGSAQAVNLTTSLESHFMVFQNQTGYDWFPFVYDPGGFATDASLTESFSLVGMVNGSVVSGIPSWLRVDVVTSSVTLAAHVPAYVEVTLAPSASAPLGNYAILVKGVIDGQTSFIAIPFWVSPPIRFGPS